MSDLEHDVAIQKKTTDNQVKKPLESLSLQEIYNVLIADYGIDFQFQESELRNLPKQSPFIVISNHPLKGIDSILLLKVIAEVRPDIKIANDVILPKYTPIQKYFIFSHKFHRTKLSRKKAIEYLKQGKPLGIFPAGDFSLFSFATDFSNDPIWSTETIRFIKSVKVPIVPVYFQVKSSIIQSLLNGNYWLMPLLTKGESKNKVRNIRLRIGAPIDIEDQTNFNNIDKFGRFLRSKVYCLGSPVEVPAYFAPRLKSPKKVEPIAPPVSRNELRDEVEQIKKEYLLFDSGSFSVICCPSNKIPLMMHEIGRERELTFRQVDEGTNRSIDLDEFDLYYQQLFIWDNAGQSLVGAYRVGKGNEIMQQYGIKGFYIQSLFRVHDDAGNILSQSLELGRSFVVPAYQKQPLSLFLLWKGILYFLIKNPEYRYLIGPVSISNHYSKASKSLIIKFMMENFFHKELATLFKPRNAYKPKMKYDLDVLVENTKSNLNKLDSMISDIEFDNYKIPVLLKKYLKLNAKIIAFNIDPLFNNALDGLIILDVLDIPLHTIQNLSKEINDETLLSRFTQE
ncbi:MAG TPA: hemolysin [Marinilabiliales bacterium]|nr:hemolysin [Marinilabiliales bacterium]